MAEHGQERAALSNARRYAKKAGYVLRDLQAALGELESTLGEDRFGRYVVDPDDVLDEADLLDFVRLAYAQSQGRALVLTVVSGPAEFWDDEP